MAKDRAFICTCGHDAGQHSTSTLESPPLSYYHPSGLGPVDIVSTTDDRATICWGRHDTCVCKVYIDINDITDPENIEEIYREMIDG